MFIASRFVLKRPPTPLSELLIKDSPAVNNTHLKSRIIKDNLLIQKCLWCGLGPWWRGKPLTLELDHINGDKRDNRIENLRILCLNCHSQTVTFRRPRRYAAIQKLIKGHAVL